MLKIVVYDSGVGGEFFADRLEEELPVVEIIRVIDRQNSHFNYVSPRKARKSAERALHPYIGKVDLIVLANYSLATTSLSYFRDKYKRQKFVGFTLNLRRTLSKRPTLIITTRSITRNIGYLTFARRVRARTICMDDWPILINDGELTYEDIHRDLCMNYRYNNFSPKQILLLCGQFSEFVPAFHKIYGHNVRIIDGFDDAIRDTFHALRIRGGTGKKSG